MMNLRKRFTAMFNTRLSARFTSLLTALVFLATLMGCFTETGNPGDNDNAVLAKFYIDYDSPAVAARKAGAAERDTVIHITSFFMTIGDAEFDTDLGDTDFFAGKPKPLVDFTIPKTLLWIKPDALS